MSEAVNGEAVDKIANLARSAAELQVVTVSVNSAGLPSSFPLAFDKRQGGLGVKSLREEAEKWRTGPERKKGTARPATLLSFIELTNRHKEEGSVIFAQTTWPNPSLTTIINYNGEGPGGAARFGDHRFVYSFPITDEFKAWAEFDNKPLDQATFAAFIEERVFDLADPNEVERVQFGQMLRTEFASPSRMVELSRGLQVNVASVAKSGVTLQSGESEIQFAEEHRDAHGEKLIVPGLFMIAMPAFIGGEPVRIPVRLRYRVKGGAVMWFYQMFRWKEFLRERVVADLDQAETETSLATFEGTPEQ